MTNHELKGWLRAKGLGISGAKNVLIQRIKDYLRVQEQERNNVDASNDTNSSSDASFSSERFHSRKKDAFDPMVHISASTFDFDAESNSKSRARHHKIGYRERLKTKKENIIIEGNLKVARKNEVKVQSLTCSGLFCCTAIDPTTGGRCIAGPFSSQVWLDKHNKMCDRGINTHTFPSVNSTTQTIIDATSGKFALSLAVGSMTNRDRAVSAPYEVVPCKEIVADERVPADYWMETGFYRRDNKKWRKPQFKATEALNADLEALFLEGEKQTEDGARKKATKFTAVEAVSILRNMIGDDGHRKYRIGGPNGAPPDVAFVKARFSKRKNDGARALLRKTNEDRYDGMDTNDLKTKYEQVFSESLTEKRLLSRILEIDDEIKHGGHDNQYQQLTTSQLQTECRNRKLPFKLGKDALKTVMRANDKLEAALYSQSSEAFRNAADLSAASSTQYSLLNDNDL